MLIIPPDTELEYEVQELYILAKYWLNDISFAEDELRFFKDLLVKFHINAPEAGLGSQWQQFNEKIAEQEQNIANLKLAIPKFIAYLTPYVGDQKKTMDLSLLQRYNGLDDEIKQLLTSVKITKSELFACAESILELGRQNAK
ncbi:hypothetical protein BEL04_06215 [Mucilaginibacter sp. PPCGB 2223]|uniref:hypothetical protein n=1 Tax=Mucilaginibacter sp. PPCGB 2223 TaxID=1886027 RepID=UPI0008248145|nr:hypothetical protein [Mucilaginibacter sp. PPCGB 2223]OCX53877.1 hypothetical protein BEL04_06215 [Mucilaginibacter sp. PPCGB 2223]